MKKILTLILCLCSFAFAFGSSHDTEANIVYLKDTKLQIGAEGTIDLMLKSENPIGAINVTFDLPAGITINSIVSEGAYVTWNPEAKNLLLGKGDPYYTTGKVATINVTVAANAAIGNQTITLPMVAFTQPDLTTFNYENVTSDLALQRAAVIDPMDDGYALEIVPFAIEEGATSAEAVVNMTNKDEVAYISFDVVFPEGITPAKSGRAFLIPEVNVDRLTNGGEIAPLTAEKPQLVEESTYHYKLKNDEVDTYDKNGSGMAMTLPLAISNTVGIKTLKIKNINIQSTNDPNYEIFTSHTGSNLSSVFAGNTTSDANPILYGHYTSDVVAALAAKTDVKAMLSNDVASVDVTAATIDGDASALFNGNLVYAPTKTSYSRTTGEWGSICLPIALENNENISYYEVKELNIAEGKVVLGKITGTLEANTPAFYNTKAGSLSAEAEGYLLAETPSTAAELVGVYEKTTLAPNAGYYISGGKLYNDGATVKPFRAYLNAPTAASKELKIFVDESTGLRDVTAEFPAEAIYNLQGMKLQQTQRGINIIGGKKVLIKK